MLVVSRDAQLRHQTVAEIIKSPAWTTAVSARCQPQRPVKTPNVMGFTLSHIQHNFLRCSHTGDITVPIHIIVREDGESQHSQKNKLCKSFRNSVQPSPGEIPGDSSL